MKTGDWLFLAITGLCTVPLQAAIIYTLWGTFREPGDEPALPLPEPVQLRPRAHYPAVSYLKAVGDDSGCFR